MEDAMKRSLLAICAAWMLCALGPPRAYPAAYEASTLHNSVSRSETVLDLFFQRWESIQERELYLDWYGRINWVSDFKINTVNAGTGEKETVPMTLVRTYGSITVNYPVVGGYEGAAIMDRLSGKRKKEKEGEDKGSGPMGLWKPRNLVLGFTATGFHYGLTREAKIDRGAAGSETATDYKSTQFFDDIFALSVLYRPYFYIHGGVIINNQIEPRDDGTMDYTDSSNLKHRYFIASNLLSFLNTNATSAENKLESIAVGVEVTKLAGMLMSNSSPYIPRLTVTYKLVKLFNDQPYDSVWVRSPYINGNPLAPKSSAMPSEAREEASLHTLSFLIKQNIYEYIFIDLFAELQRPSATLIEKRTGDEIEFNTLRETYAALGFNFLGEKAKDGFLLVASVGASRYWDVAIPIHRKSGTDYYLYGGFASVNLTTPFAGIEIKGIYNYAPELRKLVETADKFAVEGSVYLSI
jgi:hypothetical protein